MEIPSYAVCQWSFAQIISARLYGIYAISALQQVTYQG